MTAAATLGAGVLVVLAITAVTGYFVAQEFAYMAVDRSRLKARAERGDTAAARALAVTRRTSFMLSGAQLGITVTGLVVGYVAEPLIGDSIAALLGTDRVPAGIGLAVGAVTAVVFSTVVQMVFGELVPKNLAIARPEPVARWLARSTTAYLAVFGWLIRLFDAASRALLRMLRIAAVHDVEHAATARDLEHIVAESRDAGELPAELSAILDRILDFPTRTAEHAMIPRALTDVVTADDSVDSVLAKMAVGHTRYPVVGVSTDDLVGVVRLHDLLGTADGRAGSHARPAILVPTTLPLTDVQSRLVAADDEMALVIDEYGGFAGIITLEDMAEELIGEIADEHDTQSEDIVRVDGGWLIDGHTHLDEVGRAIGHELVDGDYETLAGLVIAQFGGLPSIGDVVEIGAAAESLPVARAEVRAVERHVPARLFISEWHGADTKRTANSDG